MMIWVWFMGVLDFARLKSLQQVVLVAMSELVDASVKLASRVLLL